MQLSQRQVFLILVVIVVVGVTGFFIYSSLKTEQPGLQEIEGKRDVRLSVWGVDPPSSFATIKKNFEALNKDVAVSYSQIPASLIQDRLVQALANGQAPDVVMIKNRTLPRQQNFLTPAPNTKIGITTFRNLFPTVAEQDFVIGGKQIYALPLSIDTLALIYNKDLFDQAQVVQPPTTWTGLAELVPKFVKIGEGGRFERSAVALGGSEKTVTNVGDILPLLFMQSGVDLSKGSLETDGRGLQAFNFYLQFSNPRSLAYTWDDLQQKDLASLANLKTAMVLAYKRQLATVTAQNDFLHYGIAPAPQLGKDRVDYADYWGLAVTRTSRNANRAWDLVIYATTVPQNAQSYIQATKYPPALRSLISSTINDPELGVFAGQALTARSWALSDDVQSRELFSSMVSSYLSGQVDQGDALRRTQTLLSSLVVSK